MKKINENRSLIVLIILSVCTLGVFFFYHQYCKIRDINIMCEGDGQYTTPLPYLVVLWICTCSIYGIIWNYQVANRLHQNMAKCGITYPILGGTVGALTFLGRSIPPLMLFAQYKIIQATNCLAWHYNNRKGTW